MANTKIKKNTEGKEETKSKTHPLVKGPRVTEKSAIDAEKGIYTFNIAENANKNEIKKAINTLYGVKPLKISITKIARKPIVRRGVVSKTQAGKKAVVHLKKGDKITFV